MSELVITAANCVTSVGHDGRMTSASVRAGISRMFISEDYLDGRGNPITVAQIRGVGDDKRDPATRLRGVATFCMEAMLEEYFRTGAGRRSHIHLFVGVASAKRPGPRYEESCNAVLLSIIEKWTDNTNVQTIPQGNASLHFAIKQAEMLLEDCPGALCIIGGIDSLLGTSTLNWFEQDGRLKSESYGRHQGLIAGEAVGFIVIENRRRAEQANRPALARIAGLGLAEEPIPRAANLPSRNSGLTDACRIALKSVIDRNVRDVFGDLNGENGRGREWSMAEMRCFDSHHEQRKLWTPATCYGDIGAAGGAVSVNIAIQGCIRGWLRSPVLIFCSDDHGPCGALVLERDAPQDLRRQEQSIAENS